MSQITWFPASITKSAALAVLLLEIFAGPAIGQDTPARPTIKTIPPQMFYKEAVKIGEKAETHIVTYENAKSWAAKGEGILVDLRSPDEYKRSHLKGAISLPMTDVTDESLKKIIGDSRRKVVLYCDYNFFPTRRIALTTLGYPTIYKLGYENLYTLEELWHKPEKQIEFEGTEAEKSPIHYLGN